MGEKENKKSITKILSKWITKLDTLLGSIRNIVLIIITITLIVIAKNTGFINGSVYVRGSVSLDNHRAGLNVNVINTPDVNVDFPYVQKVDMQ